MKDNSFVSFLIEILNYPMSPTSFCPYSHKIVFASFNISEITLSKRETKSLFGIDGTSVNTSEHRSWG